jgi:ABC-type multidrug transport system ATPase subunit
VSAASSTDAFDFDRVEVEDVSRRFGRRRALAHVSLTATAGEIVGLFGPNGAGKSTLLGVLSTILRPTSGAVRYGTRDAREIGDVLRTRLGVLGHDLFLYGDLTARENLEFFGRLYGLRDLSARVDRALADARLEDRAGDRAKDFSRGLRQRLALERALLHDPRLVLLDEPFTGLDDRSSQALRARLADIARAGAIVVVATHDFESAEGLVDRGLCLASGRAHPLVPEGESLLARYRRTLAAAGA